jgi:hypothetical protein
LELLTQSTVKFIIICSSSSSSGWHNTGVRQMSVHQDAAHKWPDRLCTGNGQPVYNVESNLCTRVAP